ncbi:MAG: biotin--[acetyl-CoA-carboxylase] ligase [Chloroflexota bacterium]|nr:biotin--[acetyl-CoA-carboxylase] ligase [Chloroflexota bacterium]
MSAVSPRLRRKLLDQRAVARWVGREFVYRLRTGSTMDDARALARDGAAGGAVVFAEEQTAGRGTRGRSWVSPAGQNLYFTIVLRPSVAQIQRLSLITPVAIANAVEQTLGLYPRIKWPNDLQLGGKKFAGILIEGEWTGDRPAFALVGVGVNVNFEPMAHAQLDRPATSLAIEKGRPLAREPLMAAIFASFERAFEGAEHPALFRGWRSRQALLGRPVTLSGSAAIREPGGIIEGTAEDVAEDGALLVRLPGGDLRRFQAGEVSLRGDGGRA